MLFLGLVDFFYIGIVDSVLALAGSLIGWALLAESMADGLLGWCYRHFRGYPTSPDVVQGSTIIRSGFTFVRNVLAGILRLFRRAFAANSLAGVLLKVVAWIVVLIALSELPNAGTTIIGSFSADSGAKQDSAQALASRLMYALHTLHEGLRSDVALISRGVSAGDSSKFRFASTDDVPAHLEAALAKHPDVPLGPVNLPVEVLIAPIQGPVRWLLGVRVISGSIHTDSQNVTALAHSSRGGTWKAQIERSHLDAGNSDITAAIPDLAEQLARQITTADGSSSAAGLTRSPDALASFELGWKAWQKFEVEGDVAALDDAVENFGKAINRHWGFSLAHYRLGRALREARQPGAAIEAFRESVASNPTFGAGLAALASTLYDYDSYSESRPISVRVASPPPTDEQRITTLYRKNEAARIWQAMVHAPARRVSTLDRASASAGLCLRAYDLQDSLENVNKQLSDVRKRLKKFQPDEAFKAWKAYDAMDKKNVTPEDASELARLKDAYEEAFEPVTEGEKERNRALADFVALGATTARVAAESLDKTMNVFGGATPDSEEAARDVTNAALADLMVLEEKVQHQGRIQSFLTYFYCTRAGRIYAALAPGEDANEDLHAGAARVAYLLGLTLDRRNGTLDQNLDWSCATSNGPMRGPYSRAALNFYDRAVSLTPDDPVIRCQAALTAKALGDSTRLDTLKDDFAARLNLAVFQSAGDPGDDAALAEYQAAIERNPNSIEALNGYAYTFWASRYTSSQKENQSSQMIAPDQEPGRRALNYALRAKLLINGKRPKDFEIMIRSTVGEVLLGTGDYEGAREELQSALALESGKEHARYNEVRWDLAQALHCLALKHDDSEGTLQSQATKLLKKIQATELGSESRPFSDTDLLEGKHSLC